MEENKAIEGVIEHTMIITDISDTLVPERFIPTNTLPRNGFSNRWGLMEMILRSTYISEMSKTVRSPFTRVESKP